METISVIIPTLNEAATIAAAVTRLQALARALPSCAFEWLVVDGGSSDGTAEVVRALPGVRLLQTEAGRGRQLHLGAQAASGECLVFLHADTVVEEDYFRALAAELKAGRTWGCARVRFVDAQGRPENWQFWTNTVVSNLRVRLRGLAYGDQSIFCDAGFYWRHGGFDPALFFFEDLRFSEQACRLERPVLLPASSLTSSRRYRTRGVAKTMWRMRRSRRQFERGRALPEIWEYYNR